jgi:hypothetical protein
MKWRGRIHNDAVVLEFGSGSSAADGVTTVCAAVVL